MTVNRDQIEGLALTAFLEQNWPECAWCAKRVDDFRVVALSVGHEMIAKCHGQLDYRRLAPGELAQLFRELLRVACGDGYAWRLEAFASPVITTHTPRADLSGFARVHATETAYAAHQAAASAGKARVAYQRPDGSRVDIGETVFSITFDF